MGKGLGKGEIGDLAVGSVEKWDEFCGGYRGFWSVLGGDLPPFIF